MKILKIENYNYSILYIEDGDNYNVYKRFDNSEWQILKDKNWIDLSNSKKLEEFFKKNNNNLKL
jgi:hypothetical protein